LPTDAPTLAEPTLSTSPGALAPASLSDSIITRWVGKVNGFATHQDNRICHSERPLRLPLRLCSGHGSGQAPGAKHVL